MSSLPPQCNLSPVPLLTLWFNLLHVYFHSNFTAFNLSGAAVSPASAAFPLILFIPQSLIAQHLLAADIVREPGCVLFLRKVLIFLLFSSKQDNGGRIWCATNEEWLFYTSASPRICLGEYHGIEPWRKEGSRRAGCFSRMTYSDLKNGPPAGGLHG